MSDTHWEPQQYGKFVDQRLRPAIELLQRVPLRRARLIYDLGCGSGEPTLAIAERYPDAEIHGVDHSTEMLAAARQTASGIEWLEADIASWAPPQPPDLIYSNAALHWVANHALQFPRLLAALAPGGCLAVQMPLSWSAPTHQLMRDVLARGGPDGAPLGPATLREQLSEAPVHPAAFYYDLLAPLTATLDIWETEYLQVLQGDDPVLAWVRGAGLRPVLNGLSEVDRDVFIATYRERLREAYPQRADGATLMPFRRLFLVASRTA